MSEQNSDTPYPDERRIEIVISNKTLGDEMFVHQVKKVLSDYLDMLEKGVAGNYAFETYDDGRGNEMMVTSDAYNGTEKAKVLLACEPANKAKMVTLPEMGRYDED